MVEVPIEEAYKAHLTFCKLKGEKPVPDMTDPLGKHWDQPSRYKIAFTEDGAYMQEETFKKLHNYEVTNPSGTYAGKMWRRGPLLCWFIDDPNDSNYCITMSCKIIIDDTKM